MKKFEDLKFVEKKNGFGGEIAVMFFENGYGISVICGHGAYASDNAPYECAVMIGDEYDSSFCDTTPITNDVIGYQTKQDVTEVMAQIQKLKGRIT